MAETEHDANSTKQPNASNGNDSNNNDDRRTRTSMHEYENNQQAQNNTLLSQSFLAHDTATPTSPNSSLASPLGGIMMRQQRSETSIPPKHAFQLRMKGLVNSLVSSSSQSNLVTEQQDRQQGNNTTTTIPSLVQRQEYENLRNTSNRIDGDNYQRNNNRYYNSGNHNRIDHDHDEVNNNNDIDTIDRETELQMYLIHLWGKSYASHFISFFWNSIIASILIGSIIGALTFSFITVTYYYGVDHDGLYRFIIPTQLMIDNTYSYWFISIMGGIIIGMIHLIHLIVIKDPLNNAVIPNIFHRLSIFLIPSSRRRIRYENVLSEIMSILSSLVVIIIGVPVGPETAIIIMACLIPKLLLFCVVRCQTIQKRNKPEKQRMEALWIQVSIASAMTSMIYIITYIVTKGLINPWNSPVLLLGTLLVHEISVICRPTTLTLDAHVQHIRSSERQQRRRGSRRNYRGIEDDDDDDDDVGLFEPHTTSDTLIATTTTHYGLEPRQIVSAAAATEQAAVVTSSSSHRFVLRPNEHDYIEGLTVQLIGSTAALATIRLLMYILGTFNSMPSNNNESLLMGNMNRTESGVVAEGLRLMSTIGDVYDDEMITDGWHLAIAIPMGIICGLVSSILIGLIDLLHVIRRMIYYQSKRRCITKYLFVFLWPIVTLLLLEVVRTITSRSYSIGMGISVLQRIYETIYRQRNYSSLIPLNVSSLSMLNPKFMKDLSTLSSASNLEIEFGSMLILSRGLCVAISLGLGGLIGGITFPLFIIGIGVGVVFGLVFHFPLSLTIPCCMAGCTVSIFPAPITIVLTTIVILSCSLNITGPLFVTSLSAWMVTGGLGIIRVIDKKRTKLYQHQTSSQVDINTDDMHLGFLANDFYGSSNDLSNISDDEYLRDIRSTIFGNS